MSLELKYALKLVLIWAPVGVLIFFAGGWYLSRPELLENSGLSLKDAIVIKSWPRGWVWNEYSPFFNDISERAIKAVENYLSKNYEFPEESEKSGYITDILWRSDVKTRLIIYGDQSYFVVILPDKVTKVYFAVSEVLRDEPHAYAPPKVVLKKLIFDSNKEIPDEAFNYALEYLELVYGVSGKDWNLISESVSPWTSSQGENFVLLDLEVELPDGAKETAYSFDVTKAFKNYVGL